MGDKQGGDGQKRVLKAQIVDYCGLVEQREEGDGRQCSKRWRPTTH